MTARTSVVVTGAAVHTSLGIGCHSFWRRLTEGDLAERDTKITTPRRFPAAAQTKAEERAIWSGHPLADRLLQAIEHDLGSFLRGLSEEQKERMGVALGNAYAHLGPYLEYFRTGTQRGYQFVNPRHFPFTMPNACTVEINAAYSLRGSSTTVGTGWSAGLEAIGYAVDQIRLGNEHAMLAGAAEELNDCNQDLLSANGLRSKCGRVRPFCADRDGTVPGEAVALLLIQSAEAARATGREVLAEIGRTVVAGGVYWDSPGAEARAIEAMLGALADLDLTADDVDAVFPSAAGTLVGDAFEEAVLRSAFRQRPDDVMVYTVKTISGECFAAGGPLQCLAALYGLAFAPDADDAETSRPPQNGLRLGERITRCTTALVYTAGFDGTFAAVALRRPTTR